MKSIILILLILGVLFMTISYMERYKKCPLPKIEYRYIPRSFYEEQISTTNLKNFYSDMFNEAEAWAKYPLASIGAVNSFNNANYSNFIQEYGTQPKINAKEFEDV